MVRSSVLSTQIRHLISPLTLHDNRFTHVFRDRFDEPLADADRSLRACSSGSQNEGGSVPRTPRCSCRRACSSDRSL